MTTERCKGCQDDKLLPCSACREPTCVCQDMLHDDSPHRLNSYCIFCARKEVRKTACNPADRLDPATLRFVANQLLLFVRSREDWPHHEPKYLIMQDLRNRVDRFRAFATKIEKERK